MWDSAHTGVQPSSMPWGMGKVFEPLARREEAGVAWDTLMDGSCGHPEKVLFTEDMDLMLTGAHCQKRLSLLTGSNEAPKQCRTLDQELRKALRTLFPSLPQLLQWKEHMDNKPGLPCPPCWFAYFFFRNHRTVSLFKGCPRGNGVFSLRQSSDNTMDLQAQIVSFLLLSATGRKEKAQDPESSFHSELVGV